MSSEPGILSVPSKEVSRASSPAALEPSAELGDWVEDLYRRTHDRLRRFLSRACEAGSISDAVDDLLVETYERAMVRRDELLTHPRQEAWLYVTARHLVLNEARRAYRWREIVREVDTPAASEDENIGLEAREDLVTALQRVRARHRDVLFWSSAGLSYEEIAKRLNAPITCVPPLLYRARLALRREYMALVERDER